MSYTTTYMGLTVWNLLSDLFDHTQLQGDFVAIDGHDHTTGKGKQIPTGGIADGAITTAKIATGAITTGLLGTGVVEGSNIDPTTTVTIAGLTVTGNETVGGSLTVQNGIFGLLVTTAVNTSVTAANSQLILYYGSGGHTTTLPTPVNGAMIGITCVKQGLTGANPLTVTASSGKIYGLGISTSGVTSIKLGAAGAKIILQADGANWYIIAGEQDTGWVNISLTTGWASLAGSNYYAPACRLRGDTVLMRGALQATSSSPGNLFVPSGMIPAQTAGISAIVDSSNPSVCQVYGLSMALPALRGEISLGVQASGSFNFPPSGAGITLDGANYSIS